MSTSNNEHRRGAVSGEWAAPRRSAHLGMLRENISWQDHAACREMDPELFFQIPSDPAVFLVCESCPVKTECRDYAERWSIRHGVWGGKQMDGGRTIYGGTCRNGHERTPDNTTFTPDGFRKCVDCETARVGRVQRNRRRRDDERAA